MTSVGQSFSISLPSSKLTISLISISKSVYYSCKNGGYFLNKLWRCVGGVSLQDTLVLAAVLKRTFKRKFLSVTTSIVKQILLERNLNNV